MASRAIVTRRVRSSARMALRLLISVMRPTSPPIRREKRLGILGNDKVYVYDLTSQTTTLVTATTSGTLSAGNASNPVFSPDGTALAYISSGTDLTANTVDPAAVTSSKTPVRGFPSCQCLRLQLLLGHDDRSEHHPQRPPCQRLGPGPVVHARRSVARLREQCHGPDQQPIHAAGLTRADIRRLENLFVTNVGTGVTTLVSVTPDGQLSNSSVERIPSVRTEHRSLSPTRQPT